MRGAGTLCSNVQERCGHVQGLSVCEINGREECVMNETYCVSI